LVLDCTEKLHERAHPVRHFIGVDFLIVRTATGRPRSLIGGGYHRYGCAYSIY
jgi:hypothetical protein